MVPHTCIPDEVTLNVERTIPIQPTNPGMAWRVAGSPSKALYWPTVRWSQEPRACQTSNKQLSGWCGWWILVVSGMGMGQNLLIHLNTIFGGHTHPLVRYFMGFLGCQACDSWRDMSPYVTLTCWDFRSPGNWNNMSRRLNFLEFHLSFEMGMRWEWDGDIAGAVWPQKRLSKVPRLGREVLHICWEMWAQPLSET